MRCFNRTIGSYCHIQKKESSLSNFQQTITAAGVFKPTITIHAIFCQSMLKRFTNSISVAMINKNGMPVLFCCLVFFTSIFTSCKKNSFLDQTVTSSLNEETTFKDSANSMAFLNNIYTNIGYASDPRRFSGSGYAGGLDAASDEAEAPNSSSTNGFIQFATGTVNPSIVPDDAWNIPYTNIRAANQFLKHLPIIPFSPTLKQQATAEVRFLRAWYYFTMLEHYGGVPLVAATDAYTESPTNGTPP